MLYLAISAQEWPTIYGALRVKWTPFFGPVAKVGFGSAPT
jgi:hypothetical protein